MSEAGPEGDFATPMRIHGYSPLIAAGFLLLAAIPAQRADARQDPGPGTGQELLSAEPDTTDSIKPGAAMLRSVVFPGWGQIYTRHPIKGGLMIIMQTAFIGMAIKADNQVKDLAARQSLYDFPPQLEDEIESWRTQRRTWILRAFGLWFYSMADAFVDAHLHNFDEVEPKFEFEVDPPGISPAGAGLRLQLRIPFLN